MSNSNLMAVAMFSCEFHAASVGTPSVGRRVIAPRLAQGLGQWICALAEQRQDMKDAFSLQQDALQLTLQVSLRSIS